MTRNTSNTSRPLSILFALLCLVPALALAQPSGIIVNEFSNGNQGSREYIELLVVGQPCSVLDLRNWIVDDNNGDFGSGGGNGIAPGHLRFANVNAWSAIPVGSLILLYNPNDPNQSISLPDDPTDSNSDQVYVLPIDHTSLEACTDAPTNSDPSYNCTLGYATASWNVLGLRNAGDAVQTRQPNGNYFHGVAYGNLNGGPDNLHFAGSGGQMYFYFEAVDYTDIANFGSADVSTGGETPGAPNTNANANYISNLQAGASQVALLGNDTTVCGNVQLTLDAGSGFSTYVWSTGSTNQSITASGAGIYWVEATVGGNCVVSDTIEIAESPAPSLTLTSDTNFCPGDSTTVTANSNAPSLTWSTGETTTSITVHTAGTYSVTATNAQGCTETQSVTITVGAAIPPNLGNDSTFCEAFTTTLYPGSYQVYSWSTGSNDSSITVNANGTYAVTVLDANGCVDSDSITFTLNAIPPVDLGPNTQLCPGEFLSLDAGSGYDNYSWSTGQLGNPVPIFGPQTVWVAVTLGQCTASDTILIEPRPGSVGSNLNDTTVCQGETLLLDATLPGNLSYVWSSGATTPTVQLGAGTHTLAITGACGTVVDTIVVAPIECATPEPETLIIPNIVTPNSDGNNDTWRIVATPDKPVQLVIYNRWGRKMWEGAALTDEWDATDVTDGTYFYVVTLNPDAENEAMHRGHVTVMH